MKKTLKTVALVLSALVVFFLIFKNRLIDYFLEPVTKKLIEERSGLKLEDGLHIVLFGTGSPMPDVNRAGACVGVIAGTNFYVIDAGEGSTKNISLSGLNAKDIDGILLTHFHSDHIADLGELMLQRWASAVHYQPVPVYGPIGVDEVVESFNAAYQLDKGYRVAHHGAAAMPPSGAGGKPVVFELNNAYDASKVVLDTHGLKITAFKVDHFPAVPAVGYIVEYKGRKVVVSGDTKYCLSVINHAKNADLLLHEALNKRLVGYIEKYDKVGNASKIAHDIVRYHTTPEQVARIGEIADVKDIVLYHIIPPLPDFVMNAVFLGNSSKYFKGKISIGSDGMLISLPAESEQINYKQLIKK